MNIYKNLKYYYASYKKYIFLIILISPISAFFEYINIALLYNLSNILINKSVSEDYGMLFGYIQQIIEILYPDNLVISAALLLIITIFFKTFGMMLSSYLMARLSQIMRKDLQNKLTNRYLFAPYGYYSHKKQGDMVFNITQATVQISAVIKIIPNIFISLLRIGFILALMLTVSLQITIIVCIFALCFWLIVSLYSNKIGYTQGDKVTKALSKITVTSNEFITGIKIVKSYLIEDHFSNIMNKTSIIFYKAKMIFERYRIVLMHIMEFFVFSIFAVILIILSIYSKDALMTLLPSLLVYILSIYKIIPMINQIGEYRLDLMHFFPVLELIKNELEEPISRPHIDGDKVVEYAGNIEFKNIYFSYGEKLVLNNISFEFKKNKVTAIVGKSGSGKTTIINLLLKLYLPSSGEILLTGKNIVEYKRTSYLNKIAYVSQEPILFNDTIANNIGICDLPSIDENKMKKVAEIVHIDEFIDKLPSGYDNTIGDMGSNLSGGQKQRICLARALYRNPEIIILDEAISSLDNISQTYIIETVKKLSNRITFIIISHKISTIEFADNIIVIKDGIKIEEGAHNDLVNLGGEYSSLYRDESIKS